MSESSGLHHLQSHCCLFISKNTLASFTVVGPSFTYKFLGSVALIVAKVKNWWLSHELSLALATVFGARLYKHVHVLFHPHLANLFHFRILFFWRLFSLQTLHYITSQTAQNPWPRSDQEPFPAETYTHQRFSMSGKRGKKIRAGFLQKVALLDKGGFV